MDFQERMREELARRNYVEARIDCILRIVQHFQHYCRKEDLPYPRIYRRRLPVVLSPGEAMRLIDSARNLFHRAMLMTR